MRYKATFPYSLYLCTAGRDSLFVCGQEAHNEYNMTHYNLLTGEERSTVRLNGLPWGLTTVLYNNQKCVALSYFP